MKGSSSFAHARRLTVAILILLLASAGEMAEDEQIFGNGESVSPPETEEEGLRMDHQLPSGTGESVKPTWWVILLLLRRTSQIL